MLPVDGVEHTANYMFLVLSCADSTSPTRQALLGTTGQDFFFDTCPAVKLSVLFRNVVTPIMGRNERKAPNISSGR